MGVKQMDNSKKENYFDLTNDIAIITGASGLLGIHHAKALLEQNATVVITDIDEKALKRQYGELSNIYGKKVVAMYMDVTDEASIRATNNDIKAKVGMTPNILINNAAINPAVSKNGLEDSSLLEEFSVDRWNNEINVGLTGSLLCSRVFGQSMVETLNKGIILNIASDLSVIAPDQRLYNKSEELSWKQAKPVTYSVIKAGVVGLTKYLATYWAKNNIRCNSLSPGGVANGQNEEFQHKLNNLIPMNRMAQVDEYKGAIQFLCSEASSYLTGQNIVIDGGRSIW